MHRARKPMCVQDPSSGVHLLIPCADGEVMFLQARAENPVTGSVASLTGAGQASNKFGGRRRMDQLFLNSIGFPVRSGTLSRNRDEADVRSWRIEIHCGESPQLDYRSWPDDRQEDDLDWLASTEPSLYAQMLPLPADSPDDLVGRPFSFTQSPDDKPADWDRGVGWLFFCLYLFENDLVYPTTVIFTERREQRYRVHITGSYRVGDMRYDLRVEAWLDWVA